MPVSTAALACDFAASSSGFAMVSSRGLKSSPAHGKPRDCGAHAATAKKHRIAPIWHRESLTTAQRAVDSEVRA